MSFEGFSLCELDVKASKTDVPTYQPNTGKPIKIINNNIITNKDNDKNEQKY